MTIILAALAVFVGCFFATVSGFGFALISTPLLSLVLSPKEAIIIVPILTIVLRIITMYQTRKDCDLELLKLVMFGWIIGIVPGAYILKILTVKQLQIFLGLCLVLATFLMGKQYYIPIANKVAGRLGAGFLSGFFCASTSVSGPSLVLYFLNEKLDKDYMRSNMIWAFGIGNTLSTLMNAYAGNMKAIDDWNMVMLMVPVVFLATFLGNKAFKYVDQELFRKLALCIVLFGCIMMLYNGLK